MFWLRLWMLYSLTIFLFFFCSLWILLANLFSLDEHSLRPHLKIGLIFRPHSSTLLNIMLWVPFKRDIRIHIHPNTLTHTVNHKDSKIEKHQSKNDGKSQKNKIKQTQMYANSHSLLFLSTSQTRTQIHASQCFHL